MNPIILPQNKQSEHYRTKTQNRKARIIYVGDFFHTSLLLIDQVENYLVRIQRIWTRCTNLN